MMTDVFGNIITNPVKLNILFLYKEGQDKEGQELKLGRVIGIYDEKSLTRFRLKDLPDLEVELNRKSIFSSLFLNIKVFSVIGMHFYKNDQVMQIINTLDENIGNMRPAKNIIDQYLESNHCTKDSYLADNFLGESTSIPKDGDALNSCLSLMSNVTAFFPASTGAGCWHICPVDHAIKTFSGTCAVTLQSKVRAALTPDTVQILRTGFHRSALSSLLSYLALRIIVGMYMLAPSQAFVDHLLLFNSLFSNVIALIMLMPVLWNNASQAHLTLMPHVAFRFISLSGALCALFAIKCGGLFLMDYVFSDREALRVLNSKSNTMLAIALYLHRALSFIFIMCFDISLQRSGLLSMVWRDFSRVYHHCLFREEGIKDKIPNQGLLNENTHLICPLIVCWRYLSYFLALLLGGKLVEDPYPELTKALSTENGYLCSLPLWMVALWMTTTLFCASFSRPGMVRSRPYNKHGKTTSAFYELCVLKALYAVFKTAGFLLEGSIVTSVFSLIINYIINPIHFADIVRNMVYRCNEINSPAETISYDLFHRNATLFCLSPALHAGEGKMVAKEVKEVGVPEGP